MSNTRPIVVADTVIFLQASINETNVASSFLRRVEAGELTLCISRQLILEIREVLTRDEIRAKNSRLSNHELEDFIQGIEANSQFIDPLPTHFRYPRDPDDEHVLNLAIEAKANVLVSYDKDLLSLMDTIRQEGSAFRRTYPGLIILTPGELITRLNAGQG